LAGLGLGSGVIHGNATAARISVILPLFFLLLLAFLPPDLVDVEKLNSHQITFKGAVPVLASTDEDVSIQIGSSDICVASVLLVDAKNTSNQLTVTEESRKGSLRQVRSEKRLALLLLLLLHRHLRLRMLGSLKASHALATHLSSLKGLEMSNLQGIKLVKSLSSEHLLLEQHLALRKLHKLGLAWVLEVANRAHGLVNRTTGTVTGLERRSVRSLVHIEVAHILGLVVLGRLRLRLSPVTVEVTGTGPAMAAAPALEVRLTSLAAV
jgi:hypothetical protein